jgi:hypothetical protein
MCRQIPVKISNFTKTCYIVFKSLLADKQADGSSEAKSADGNCLFEIRVVFSVKNSQIQSNGYRQARIRIQEIRVRTVFDRKANLRRPIILL